MFKLNQKPRFTRKLKKLFKQNSSLATDVRSTLERLQRDPFDPGLRSHKVTARDGGRAFSSRLTGDLRIIWRYNIDSTVQLVDLIDIGGHSGSGKVYR